MYTLPHKSIQQFSLNNFPCSKERLDESDTALMVKCSYEGVREVEDIELQVILSFEINGDKWLI
jgi:hypothetical protein